jgi:hypothetical protein
MEVDSTVEAFENPQKTFSQLMHRSGRLATKAKNIAEDARITADIQTLGPAYGRMEELLLPFSLPTLLGPTRAHIRANRLLPLTRDEYRQKRGITCWFCKNVPNFPEGFPEISAEDYQRALMKYIKKHGNPTENKEESFLLEWDETLCEPRNDSYACE